MKNIKYLKDKFDLVNQINKDFDLLEFHIEVVDSEQFVSNESIKHLNLFNDILEKFEISTLLSDKDDNKDVILNIHPGAGGKESEDWAFMLFRMYKRWCDKNKYNMKVLNYHDGDENGLKDVSIEINGENVYGNLKSEIGVHRLVRISPFDSNSRRHTSFASVFVYPVLDDNIDIKIEENDIKVDTYRASGAGGQHVNKTDSAVRITHLPTGIVTQCQNERSQLKNKNTAMKILKSRLYQKRLDERKEDLEQISGDKKDISWGSQIRSYVFHPYNLIKDHRTDMQTSNIGSFMDGDIDLFIKEYLINNMEKK